MQQCILKVCIIIYCVQFTYSCFNLSTIICVVAVHVIRICPNLVYWYMFVCMKVVYICIFVCICMYVCNYVCMHVCSNVNEM